MEIFYWNKIEFEYNIPFNRSSPKKAKSCDSLKYKVTMLSFPRSSGGTQADGSGTTRRWFLSEATEQIVADLYGRLWNTAVVRVVQQCELEGLIYKAESLQRGRPLPAAAPAICVCTIWRPPHTADSTVVV